MKNIFKKGIVTVMAAATLCMGTLPALAYEPEETVIEITESEEPAAEEMEAEETEAEETEAEETEAEETEPAPTVPEEFIWGEMDPYDYEWVSVCIFTEEDGWYYYQCIKGQTWKTLVKENPEELSIIEDCGMEIIVLHTSDWDYNITASGAYVTPDTVVDPDADYWLELNWM